MPDSPSVGSYWRKRVEPHTRRGRVYHVHRVEGDSVTLEDCVSGGQEKLTIERLLLLYAEGEEIRLTAHAKAR